MGLNFRDVLNVLGMYPGDPGPPGADCAGVVTAVGAGVTSFVKGTFNSFGPDWSSCLDAIGHQDQDLLC